MFTDNVWNPWANPSSRGWTTLISFTLQSAGVALLVFLPIIYGAELPHPDLVRRIFAPLPPAGAHASAAPRTTVRASGNYSNSILVVAPGIPKGVSAVDDRRLPPPDDLGPGVLNGTGPPAVDNSVINSIGEMTQPFVPKPPAPVARPPRVSVVMEGYLVHKIEPLYPPLARAARVQGSVELQAVISKQGTIEKLQVLRGHPLLVKAAVEAVQQWRYRPYILNGEPVEVETHVTVNFSLSGG
jgi:protein TonB